MNYADDALITAHKHSSRHRDELERSIVCGCFYCCETYPPAEIQDWCDEGDTALCPVCGIDSVIGSASGSPVEDKSLLKTMHKRWFT